MYELSDDTALLRPEEMASKLCISLRTLQKMLKDGTAPDHIRLGRKVLFPIKGNHTIANVPEKTMGQSASHFSLTDADAMSSAHPDTFYKPPQALIYQLCAGDLVKLGLEVDDNPHCGGERMWVRVTSITPEGFEGRLQNMPAFLDGFEPGQCIRFKARNILDLDLHAVQKASILFEHGVFDDDQLGNDRSLQ